jgi:4-hydroxybenzoate polyprenyltransferase
MDYIKAYYRVCRLEYAPGEIPAMLTVLFLGSATVARFFDFIVIEALLAFMLLYLSGFIINAITDKEIDTKYDTFKTSIPKSVDILGEKTLWGLIIGHVVVSIILAFHISLQMSNFLPLVLVLLGVFFGLGYSVRPFHFKVRGVWHAIALGSSAFFLPFIFLMFVVAEGIPIPLLTFIIGFSFVHYGMEFGNQAIDYIEDKAQNVRTPPVRWGMIPSLKIALGLVILGILTEGYSLYHVLLSKGTFTIFHPILTTNVVFGIFMGIILIGYYIPTKGLWDMLKTLEKSETVEDGMPTLKKICNYAKWQASGILGVAVVSGILFLGVVYGPVTQIVDNSNGQQPVIGDLNFSSPPEAEFFEDGEGDWLANVSISIQNDDILRDRGSLMIMVQSWVANIPFRAKSILLETEIQPNGYWNLTTQAFAHDADDTSFKIYIMIDKTGLGDFTRIDKSWNPYVIVSQKDLYIYSVEIESYEEMLIDEKANVTVTVFNEGSSRNIGSIEVKVDCYTSYWFWTDEATASNNYMLKSNNNWSPKLVLNPSEVDLNKPIFVIKLYNNNNLIDNLTVHSK